MSEQREKRGILSGGIKVTLLGGLVGCILPGKKTGRFDTSCGKNEKPRPYCIPTYGSILSEILTLVCSTGVSCATGAKAGAALGAGSGALSNAKKNGGIGGILG